MQAIEDHYKVHCGLQQLFTQHAGCAVPALPQGGGYDFTLLAQKEKAAPRRCTGLTAQLAAFLAGQTTRLETTYAADTAACTASIGEMADLLEQAGKEQELSIRIQREDIFNAMHRI